jgi:hypothetical protein
MIVYFESDRSKPEIKESPAKPVSREMREEVRNKIAQLSVVLEKAAQEINAALKQL